MNIKSVQEKIDRIHYEQEASIQAAKQHFFRYVCLEMEKRNIESSYVRDSSPPEMQFISLLKPLVIRFFEMEEKTLLATICSDAVTKWQGRVLVLSHVKELLQQAADKLQLICPGIKVGVYSAGLKSRETDAPVIVAGIQSVYKKACELDRFDLIIVDEAHLLPPDGEGMYQTFLKEAKLVNPHVRLIGLTATPYRMKSGGLVGPDNLLNHICYEIGVKELIEQGFLCPLRSKSGRHKVDYSDLHIRAGEFVQSEVDLLMNTTDNVDAAVREIVTQTRERNSILIFGVSVDHVTRIKETIEKFTSQECVS